MRRFFLAAVVAALVSPRPALAQDRLSDVEAKAVESLVTAQMQRQHVPALSLAIVRSKSVVFSRAFGVANLELDVPATTRTVFKIGSTSKPIIATGVMLLVEEGKLTLDDEIARFFAHAPSRWSGINVRHLLAHTAGFPRELPGWVSYEEFSDADLVAMIEKTEPATRPGERYAYSNAGYFTLAAILTKVSGKPWPEFLKARIFDPLDMKSTRTTAYRELVPHRASGYFWRDGRWQHEGFILTVRPSGGLMSTAEDLARWQIALEDGKLLKAQSLDAMFALTRLSSGALSAYGLGWESGEFRGRRLLAANGDLLGFRAAFLRNLDDQVTVIVLLNCESGNADAIARGVLTRLIPELAVAGWKASEDKEPEIARAFRQGLENTAANKPFGEIAIPALETALKSIPEASRKSLRERLETARSFEFLREDKVQAPLAKLGEPVDRIRYYRLTTPASIQHYATYWSSAGKLLVFEAVLE
jgi:CubicO group peptidase (beta-lactamase class C family)